MKRSTTEAPVPIGIVAGAYTRRYVHDTAVKFRVNEALLHLVEQRARDTDMSLSELVRHAVCREMKAA